VPLRAIPELVIVLRVVRAQLTQNVDVIRGLVDNLRCSLKYATHILPVSPVELVIEMQVLSNSPEVGSILSPG
jgi:hypothetical protein